MATRKRTSKAVSETHHFGALLEEIRSQQRATLEAMTMWGERLERSFNAQLERVNERLSNLEAAVTQNSRDIHH
ncbi:MAG: hypothetical protein KIT84_27540 [Labilithrix sp.]|nr:hypothetical protein [Labilithrix sp.]MCW5814812.1 hypothetical protein [Labilithrix sp.]